MSKDQKDNEKRLTPVKESDLPERTKQSGAVSGRSKDAKSVNDRGSTDEVVVSGPHGSGSVRSVNDRAATASSDDERELGPDGKNDAGADLGSRTYGDTTPIGEGSNKKGVREQFDPSGDRFTSSEATFGSSHAPMDIYPEDARNFDELGYPKREIRTFGEPAPDTDILDGPISPRDAEALMSANRFTRQDIAKAVSVLTKNPIVSPDGPETFDGVPIQALEAEGESNVAFAPAEFDTNRVRHGLVIPAAGPARGQEGVESRLDRQREVASETQKGREELSEKE